MEKIQLRLAERPDSYTMLQLERLLQPIGAAADLHPSSALAGRMEYVLQIAYEREAVNRARTRNAGRRTRDAEMTISVAELEELIRTNGASKAAETLGLSRATMYRRLQRAKENGYTLIW